MKKTGLILLMSAIMLVCILPITASAFFALLPEFPSTISSGSIWVIVGILLIAIIAAVAIIKAKKDKK